MATTALQNPFDFGFVDEVMPSTEKAAASMPSLSPGAAATDRWNLLYDEASLEQLMFDDGRLIMNYDEPPLFLSDPSPEYIAAFQRDVLPLIEDHVRRAG